MFTLDLIILVHTSFENNQIKSYHDSYHTRIDVQENHTLYSIVYMDEILHEKQVIIIQIQCILG